MGFFFFWVEKDQDIVKMIIFKFISTRLKKNLGLGGSKFILGGSNKKTKKLYIYIYIYRLGSMGSFEPLNYT